jgi:hypothetical protein
LPQTSLAGQSTREQKAASLSEAALPKLRCNMIDDRVGFLENWQDAVVVWSFVAFTLFVTWRIVVSKPKN